jgi:hypothetical protein
VRCSVNSRIEFLDGSWEAVDTTGPRRTYYYRGDTHDYRYEEILPSGRLLLQDERQGKIIKEVWTDDFDWPTLTPKGKPLGSRAVQNRQSEGRRFFVSSYQQLWSDGALADERLVCVAEYLGDQFINLVEAE